MEICHDVSAFLKQKGMETFLILFCVSVSVEKGPEGTLISLPKRMPPLPRVIGTSMVGACEGIRN